MASTTGVQRGASVPVITLRWAPALWLQNTMASVRTAVAAARDYEDARSDSARNAVLERFAADGR
jgi:hypothetical protein